MFGAMLFAVINDEFDKAKMTLLWEKYHGLMLTEAKKYVAPHEAEDIVSDTCIKLLKNLDKINEISGYQTLVYIVYTVRSVSIDFLRKAKRSTDNIVHDSDEILETLPNDDSNVLDGLIVKEGFEVIKQAILSLPKHLRDVIFLSVQGYAHAEIAELLGITEAASKMRLLRAKKEAKKRLAGDNDEKQY